MGVCSRGASQLNGGQQRVCVSLKDAHEKELSWHAGLSPISTLYPRVWWAAAVLGSGWDELVRATV